MKPFPRHSGTATMTAIGLLLACMALPPFAAAQETAAKPATTSAPAAASKSTASVSAPEAPKDVEARAQPTQPMPPVEEFEPDYVQLQVGDATQSLLDWQSSGLVASPTPRPIPGAIAYRSYERYLKSFEFPIPERLNSSVKTQSSSGGK